jgi:DNA-binding NtrC family response regulator
MRGALLVEDEALIRVVAMELLEEAGFIAFQAEDAAEALAILADRAEEISVLLTDVRLPGQVDGVTLAKSAEKNWPWIRAIITSGTPEYNHKPLPESARFIMKPWSADTLLALLEVQMSLALQDLSLRPHDHPLSTA